MISLTSISQVLIKNRFVHFIIWNSCPLKMTAQIGRDFCLLNCCYCSSDLDEVQWRSERRLAHDQRLLTSDSRVEGGKMKGARNRLKIWACLETAGVQDSRCISEI